MPSMLSCNKVFYNGHMRTEIAASYCSFTCCCSGCAKHVHCSRQEALIKEWYVMSYAYAIAGFQFMNFRVGQYLRKARNRECRYMPQMMGSETGLPWTGAMMSFWGVGLFGQEKYASFGSESIVQDCWLCSLHLGWHEVLQCAEDSMHPVLQSPLPFCHLELSAPVKDQCKYVGNPDKNPDHWAATTKQEAAAIGSRMRLLYYVTHLENREQKNEHISLSLLLWHF